MIDELDTWQRVFYNDDEDIVNFYLNQVVSDSNAQDVIVDQIRELKEKARKEKPIKKFEININLDESLKDYPVEILADEIAKDIIDNIKKDIKTIS